MTNQKMVTVEVRSLLNENTVIQFQTTETPTTSVISEGWSRICKALKMNRVQAESRFYVTKA